VARVRATIYDNDTNDGRGLVERQRHARVEQWKPIRTEFRRRAVRHGNKSETTIDRFRLRPVVARVFGFRFGFSLVSFVLCVCVCAYTSFRPTIAVLRK